MAIALISTNKNFLKLKEHIQGLDPNIQVDIWPRISSKNSVRMSVCWDIPEQALASYPNLQLIQSYGAGVSKLLEDSSIPPDIPIARMSLKTLATDMLDYIEWVLMDIRHNGLFYRANQLKGRWENKETLHHQALKIGVMGLGNIGQHVSVSLADRGYCVLGWSRTKKDLPNVRCYEQLELHTFARQCNVVVCLLPSTSETQGLLDLELFKSMPQPSFIINAGRGAHLVDEDLIYALDTQQVQGAYLDVFTQEPLHRDHHFWSRKEIMISPHIAAQTRVSDAAALIVDNYHRISSGMPAQFLVDRTKGY
jgi:glyoxylate/hydroxypyruvate reductase A